MISELFFSLDVSIPLSIKKRMKIDAVFTPQLWKQSLPSGILLDVYVWISNQDLTMDTIAATRHHVSRALLQLPCLQSGSRIYFNPERTAQAFDAWLLRVPQDLAALC